MINFPHHQSGVAPTESAQDAGPSTPPRRQLALPDAAPACFASVDEFKTLDGAAIGQCFKAIRERRQRGEDDTALSERLYRSIGTAQGIRLQVDELSWPHLSDAQEAFRDNLLDPTRFQEKPPAGVRQAYDWVGAHWALLLPPRRGQVALPAKMDKPQPVHDRPTVVNSMPLGSRLMAREAPPGATLASSEETNEVGDPRMRLVLREDRMLALETSPSHGKHAVPLAICQGIQDKTSAEMVASGNLKNFIEKFNDGMSPPMRLQLNDIGQDGAVHGAALTATPAGGPERTLQCSYTELGGSGEAMALVQQSPDLAAQLVKAHKVATTLEQRHAQQALKTFGHAGGAQYRPGLVRGCAVQLLMETSAEIQQKLAKDVGQHGGPDAPPTLAFRTPLDRTATMLKPFEQAMLQGICADLRGVDEFVRPQMSSTQIDIARQQHGSFAALLQKTMAPTAQSVKASTEFKPGAVADDSAAKGVQEWPTIGMATGLPRVALSLQYPAAATAPARTPVAPASAPGTHEAQPDYLDEALLGGSFEDSLGNAKEQPAWLQTLNQPLSMLDLEESGPQAISYQSLSGPSSTSLHQASGTQRRETGPLTERNFDTRMDGFIKEIETPGHWTGFSAELGPRFLVDCPAWPAKRGLDIVNHKTGDLLSRSGTTAPGSQPVTLALDLKRSHYSPVLDGKVLKAPGNGDCFYHSALVGLGSKDRDLVLTTMGVPTDGTVGQATRGLREHFASHLDLNRSDYQAQIIELHQQLEG